MNSLLNINIKAIIIGILVGYIATALYIVLVDMYLLIQNGLIKLTPVTDYTQYLYAIHASTNYLILTLISTQIPSIISGYSAARISQKDEIRHSLWTAVLSIIISVFFFFFSDTSFTQLPLWFIIISSLLYIPFVILGGYIGKYVNSKKDFELSNKQIVIFLKTRSWSNIALLIILGYYVILFFILFILVLEFDILRIITLIIYFGALLGILFKNKWGIYLVYYICLLTIYYGVVGMINIKLPEAGLIELGKGLILFILAITEQNKYKMFQKKNEI